MLRRDENELLVHTGPDTLMGQYLRRFWTPVLLASELPDADCPPVRVRVMGERLIAFRDSLGRIGLLAEVCPHRRASLYWAAMRSAGCAACITAGSSTSKEPASTCPTSGPKRDSRTESARSPIRRGSGAA